MHPARGTMMATETAPARRVAAARASAPRRHRAVRLALAVASAGALVGLALTLSAGSTPGHPALAASPAFVAQAAAAHLPPSVGPVALATKPKVTRHVRTPSIDLFTATPAKLPAAGGAVHLFAMVQRASTCTFSSTKPLSSLPLTRSCASGSVSISLTLPQNTTSSARTFHFQVAARGPHGPSSAGPVAVVEAAPKQAVAPTRITLEPADTSVTAGSSATFTAAAAGSAITVQWQLSSDGGTTWSPIGGADAPSYSFTTALAENGHRYRAVFTSHGRSTSTRAATLTVTAPVVVAPPASPQAVAQSVTPTATAAADSAPQITQQPEDQGQVVGSSVTFTALASGTPTPTVQWQVSTDGGNTWAPVSGATSTSYTVASVTLLQSAWEYEAVFTNSSGSQTTEPATLTVSNGDVSPQVTTQPSSVTAIAGSIVTFTAAASGVPTPSVQWMIYADGSWTQAPCQATDACSFTADASHNGDYLEAVFSNGVGSPVTSNLAILTVNAADSKPVIQTQPYGLNLASGNTASFTATASGIPAPTVQWQVSGNDGATWINAPGQSATSDTYSFTASTGESGYEYQAVFTNSVGSATSVAASLTVAPLAPQVTTQPVSEVVTSGSSATFSAAASGDPTPSVQWQVNTNNGQGWGNIAEATSPSYTINDVTSAESGYLYQAVFTNVAGSVTTDAVSLTIGAATAATYNWSGYVATGADGQFTAVSGSWVVPAASCTGSGDTYSSDWVGIDGYPGTDGTVEQDGTDSDCAGGTPTYYAWYEMYPAGTMELPSGHPVSAGDEMSASVTVSGTQWMLTVVDSGSKHSWSFTEPVTQSGLQEASVEWVAERPTVNGQYAVLTNFGSVTFTGASATLGGQGGTIASVGGGPIEMVNSSDTHVLASPGALGGSGNSFTDTWIAAS
jgi:hypothetical protein